MANKRLWLALIFSAATALGGAAFAQADSAAAAEGPGNDLLCTRWGCVGGGATASIQSWHGNADGDWSSNEGPVFGFEAAAPVPFLARYGIGAQGSWSWGASNFEGKGSQATGADQRLQEQVYYSGGLFRRPDVTGPWWSRWGLGLAYDTQLNHWAGAELDAFTLRQLRGKASYVIHGGNEVGVWFAQYHRTTQVFSARSKSDGAAPNGLDAYRAANQLNFFYKYAFARGGHLDAFIGPGRAAWMGKGSTDQPRNSDYAFDWTMGADAETPLSDYASLYGGFEYARPRLRNRQGDQGQRRRTYSVSAGVRVRWGGDARVRDDSGRRWSPYLPAPDNGNFMTVSNIEN